MSQTTTTAPQSIQPASEILHHLNRLSQKPGVQSTLILSRETGAIVRASGLLVSDAPVSPSAPTSPSKASEPSKPDGRTNGSLRGNTQDRSSGEDDEDGKTKSAEEVAGSVWRFFGAAESLVNETRGSAEDEPRLIRVRMRRSEVVVVPDSKFLLVVVHDAPAA